MDDDLRRVRDTGPRSLPGMQLLRPCGCGVAPFHSGSCWTLSTDSFKARQATRWDHVMGRRCTARLPRLEPGTLNPFTGRCELREHPSWFDHGVTGRLTGGVKVWQHRWTTETTSQKPEDTR